MNRWEERKPPDKQGTKFMTTKPKKKRIHKIGKHGAVGLLTKQGLICTECGKKIHTKKL